MIKTIECIERLQAVVDKLKADGAELPFIVASLAAVTIKTVENDRANSADYLHSAAASLTVAARKFSSKSSGAGDDSNR